jgi:hypothetical protein
MSHLGQVNKPGTPGTLIFSLICLYLSIIFFINLRSFRLNEKLNVREFKRDFPISKSDYKTFVFLNDYICVKHPKRFRMTTLTIEIPDNGKVAIFNFIKKRGGNIVTVESDDDLTPAEFDLLQESYKETLLIKKAVIKPLPISELWND